MEIINIKSLKDLLIGARFIGFGTTALCFLLRNGKVLKLYINTYNKRRLFNREKMDEHLEMLSELQNEFFIAPESIVMLNGEIIGYLMEYRRAKTVWNINLGVKIEDIVEAFKIIEEKMFIASEKKFRFYDMHEKNILFNEFFYIIDLDNGQVIKTYDIDTLMNENMCSFAFTIIRSIFRVPETKDIYFNNHELDDVYKNMLRRNYKLFFELMELLECYSKKDDAKVFNMRINKSLILRTEVHDDYYKRGGY